MRNLLTAKWIILLNTLPVLLLLGLCYAEFGVIQSLLPPAGVVLWSRFGLALGALALLTLGHGLWQLRRGRPLGATYGLGALLAYVVYLYLALYWGADLVPRAIPAWMLPTPPVFYLLTLLMPTLAHAMFVLIARLTPEEQPHSVAVNLGLALVVPLGWLLLIQVPGWFWQPAYSPFWEQLWGVMYVAGALLFLFFVTRVVYIIGLKKPGEWGEFGLVWKAVITLVLPLLGLAVNSGLFLNKFSAEDHGIFGNFSSPWFYGLAALNGLLLCLPNSTDRRWRLVQYLSRSALFGYTFYFFIVFLPFLPLSVIAIIAVGVGFLMLAPLLLLMVHLRELTTDYEALRAFYSPRVLVAGFLAGWAVLPLYITAAYLHRRATLHAALDYVYNPDYSKSYHLDAQTLAGTLRVVKQHKERSAEFMASHLPYLSTYFNWLVLDNLTLSDAKISTLEQIFLGEAQAESGPRRRWAADPTPPPTTVRLRRLSSSSTFDSGQQAWVSWVNLDVANTDTTQRAAEYVTTLPLPVGCWVGNYYLNIGARREKGILAEQKAAAWVFAQIVNENSSRDPGLLAYDGPSRVKLKVYPVAGRQVRRTGIQLLHKEPFVLTVDGLRVVLGDTTQARPAGPVATPGREVAYLSAAAKKQLPLVQRQPYYHFLLDVSARKGARKSDFRRRVLARLSRASALGQPRFSLVNTYAATLPAGADWQKSLAEATNAGGFYLERAIRQTLVEARQNPTPTYPVLIVVTDSLRKAVLPADFADLSSAYPESELFYALTPDGRLSPHSLRTDPTNEVRSTPDPGMPVSVRAWPDATRPLAYLPDNELADIVLKRSGRDLPAAEIIQGRWQTGLLLQGQQQWQVLHPEATDAQRVPFIRTSFRAGIMTPFTAYLALENDAQKAALHRKQEQVLAGKAALDVAEQTTEVPIDEGALLLLLAGAGLGLALLRRGS
ncbi:MSEP-CTERM sorting domain-containing protein [Hymenobacter algoricola]|uniref:VIT domain-containing protein n=1 Tax=Hymenobacter algoricola TaxID=486267 RepID=A0ABP7NST9_9BACT